MKICSKYKKGLCISNNPQPLSNFCVDKSQPSGLHPHCKECRSNKYKKARALNPEKFRMRSKIWDSQNRDKVRAKTAAWYKLNKERKSAVNKTWLLANPEKTALYCKKWRSNNPDKAKRDYKKYCLQNKDKLCAKAAKRRAYLKQRIPNWLTEKQKQQIDYFYHVASEFKSWTKVNLEVDHIVPLYGKQICGLHVPWNLQIITKKENALKSNKLLQGGAPSLP